jgi:hypothetical protein
MDVIFWGRKMGIFLARNPVKKENLFWKEIETKTPALYREALERLTEIVYTVQAVVIDGKRGARNVFEDIPVQHCQCHQIQTITRYLTRKPMLPAGQDLRILSLTLPYTNERTFTEELATWYKIYKDILKEKTPCSCCKANRWPYTHRRLRAAYRSLKTNIPFLFTCQTYPELHIPHTTNSPDGFFSHLKNSIGVHHGKTPECRYKMIQEILNKEG